MRIWVVIVGLSVASCNLNNTEDLGVAKAYNKTLSWEEIGSVIPDNSSAEDSIFIAQRFIQNWLTEQVILTHAENSLSEDQKDFEKQLESYRHSLLTYAFENQVIRQKLDTAVSENEIADYYEANLQNFVLKDYIVKVRFCIADSLETEKNQIRSLVFSNNTEDLVSLEALCVQRGIQYYIHEDRWLLLDDLMTQVPLEGFEPERFLKKNKTLEFERNKRVFFVKFLDYKLKDSVSPLELEKGNIRNILLNQRKLALLNQMRNDLMRDARNKNQIHIYYE